MTNQKLISPQSISECTGLLDSDTRMAAEPVTHTVFNPTTYGWQPAQALGLGVGRIKMGEEENQRPF